MDEKLFVVADGLMQLHKYGVYYMAKFREEEFQLILDTLSRLPYNVDISDVNGNSHCIRIKEMV